MTTTAFAKRTIADVMRPGIIGCSSAAPLGEVAAAMAEHRVHCVVIHGEDRVWGVVSDLDVMRAAGEGVEDACAGMVAGTEVVTVEPGESLERAAQLMADHQTAHLVVTREGHPVAVVSSLDVARALV